MGLQFAGSGSIFLCVHVLSFGLLSLQVVSWQMTEGLGYPSYNLLIIVVLLSVTVPLMLYLPNEYGSRGVAFGRLAGAAIVFLLLFVIEKRFFKKVDVGFWVRSFAIVVPAGVLAGAVEYGVSGSLPLGWFTLGVSTLAGAAVYLALLWLLRAFSEEEKLLSRVASERMDEILGRRSPEY
jgi:hypothetical protein